MAKEKPPSGEGSPEATPTGAVGNNRSRTRRKVADVLYKKPLDGEYYWNKDYVHEDLRQFALEGRHCPIAMLLPPSFKGENASKNISGAVAKTAEGKGETFEGTEWIERAGEVAFNDLAFAMHYARQKKIGKKGKGLQEALDFEILVERDVTEEALRRLKIMAGETQFEQNKANPYYLEDFQSEKNFIRPGEKERWSKKNGSRWQKKMDGRWDRLKRNAPPKKKPPVVPPVPPVVPPVPPVVPPVPPVVPPIAKPSGPYSASRPSVKVDDHITGLEADRRRGTAYGNFLHGILDHRRKRLGIALDAPTQPAAQAAEPTKADEPKPEVAKESETKKDDSKAGKDDGKKPDSPKKAA